MNPTATVTMDVMAAVVTIGERELTPFGLMTIGGEQLTTIAGAVISLIE